MVLQGSEMNVRYYLSMLIGLALAFCVGLSFTYKQATHWFVWMHWIENTPHLVYRWHDVTIASRQYMCLVVFGWLLEHPTVFWGCFLGPTFITLASSKKRPPALFTGVKPK